MLFERAVTLPQSIMNTVDSSSGVASKVVEAEEAVGEGRCCTRIDGLFR